MKSRFHSLAYQAPVWAILSWWISGSPSITFCTPGMPTTELPVRPAGSAHLLLDCVTWSSLCPAPPPFEGLHSAGLTLTAQYQWPSPRFHVPVSLCHNTWDFDITHHISMGPEFSIHNGKEEEEKRKMKHRQVRCPVYLDLIHSFAESLQTSFFTPSSFLSSARKEKKKKGMTIVIMLSFQIHCKD